MIQAILTKCDQRFDNNCAGCIDCTYGEYCPHDCEKCLDYIHYPRHAPEGAPQRKYDCAHMADVYTCKYACRYTSEIIYALKRFKDLKSQKHIKVLSFGCGPCTDLFALDFLKKEKIMYYQNIEYRGIDYSKDVWHVIHHDIKSFENENCKIQFFYEDICEIIHKITLDSWTPNLIIFQYVFSDMHKHTNNIEIMNFIDEFSQYYNTKVLPNTYMVLNDVNLGKDYGGGREYFDQLYNKLESSTVRKGRFCNDNSQSPYYPRGYTYGDDSDGEFPDNENIFDISMWQKYSPFNTCASAQMLIKKEAQIC